MTMKEGARDAQPVLLFSTRILHCLSSISHGACESVVHGNQLLLAESDAQGQKTDLNVESKYPPASCPLPCTCSPWWNASDFNPPLFLHSLQACWLDEVIIKTLDSISARRNPDLKWSSIYEMLHFFIDYHITRSLRKVPVNSDLSLLP